MRADLHLHTVYSDGLFTPAEIALKAKAQNVRLIAFTDHDSMEGDSQKEAAAKEAGLFFTRGIEISSYLEGVKVHMLGYGCVRNAAYFRFLEERKTGALMRAEDIINKANAYLGLNVTLEEARSFQLKTDAPLHTMHVARAFAKRLNVSDGEVYNKLFTYGAPAYSALCRPTPKEAIAWVHSFCGVAVLAHPGRIALEKSALEALMNELVKSGLNGIECYYTTHTLAETEYFLSYAKQKNLLITGGSDFHAEDNLHAVGFPVFEADERLLIKIKPSCGGGE